MVDAGTVTAGGFDFELNGITDSVNYVLNYMLVLSAPSIYSGSLALGNNVSTGSVTGLALAFVPSAVVSLTIQRPAGGLNLTANAISGTLSAAGFDFELDGLTDSVNYVLNYIIA